MVLRPGTVVLRPGTVVHGGPVPGTRWSSTRYPSPQHPLLGTTTHHPPGSTVIPGSHAPTGGSPGFFRFEPFGRCGSICSALLRILVVKLSLLTKPVFRTLRFAWGVFTFFYISDIFMNFVNISCFSCFSSRFVNIRVVSCGQVWFFWHSRVVKSVTFRCFDDFSVLQRVRRTRHQGGVWP